MTQPSTQVSLAIIPARGGSKAVPRKNLRLIGGRPMIAWTIDAARRAGTLDRVMVSTDDPEIAETAAACGAEVPFLRPAELASDQSPAVDTVLHAIGWLDAHGAERVDRVVLLQPTSPLRIAEDIDAALALFDRSACDSVVSVCLTPHHPLWLQQVDSDGRVSPYLPQEREPAIRQQLPPLYMPNGAIYIVDRRTLLAAQNLYGADMRAYVMPPERSLDVDTEWDLHVADLILSAAGRDAT